MIMKTIEYYNKNSQSFYDSTIKAYMTQTVIRDFSNLPEE